MKILTPDVAKCYEIKSLQRGYWVFTSCLSIRGKILFLDEHIERLLKGAHFLFPDKGWNGLYDKVRQYVLSEVDKMPDFFNKVYYLRVNILDEFIFIQKEESLEKPDTIRLTSAYKRKSPGLLPDFLKISNYVESDIEIVKASSKGFDDVIYCDNSDNITEASTSNVFIIDHDNTIISPAPSSMVLDGILRKKLLFKLKDSGYCIMEKSCTRADLLKAKEIWLTNSIKGLRFVTQYENRVFVKEKSLFDHIAKLTGRYGELL